MTSTTATIGRRTRGFDEDEYRRLLDQFPPRPIGGERQVDRVMERIDQLLSQPTMSLAEEEYLVLLSNMVERWEDEHVDIPRVDGVAMIRGLLRDRGLRQRDLVGIFGTESIISEVLSGRRELQRKHIERLSAFFHVSPAVFFPAVGGRPSGRVGR